MEQALGFSIIRLESVVFDRPRRRQAVAVTYLLEIAFAHAKQSGAEHFGIAADIIM
jgi:hypothetical protein